MSTKTQTEVYFSVDIEADGPIPGPYSMSSIGAVAYASRSGAHRARAEDLQTLDLDDEENQFYAELAPISDDFVPEAAAVSGLDRDDLIRNGMDAVTAMEEFVIWVEETTERIGGNGARAVFVGYPVVYDWMWVYWYMINFAGRSPFGHSTSIDAKTVASVKFDSLTRHMSKRNYLNKIFKSQRKHTHNALDDALEQAELFIQIQRM